MNLRAIAVGGVLTAALFAMTLSPAVRADGGDATYTFDAARRSAIIDNVKAALGSYIYPQMTQRMRARLDRDRAQLVAMTDEVAFGKAVSAALQDVAHDKHLNLVYFEHGAPKSDPSDDATPSPAEVAKESQSDSMHNGGIRGSYWLPGNIGYINLRGFPGGTDGAKRAIDAAMATVANTDALIIDVRRNGGGDPDSLDYWMGYFFQRPTELTSIHWITPKPHVDRQFSAAHVAGKFYGKPIYVLTSAHTFSCAEQFAYDMQSTHRATLVGETTGGGANPGAFNRVDDRFMVFVPTGRAYNPYTDTNWEGVGVKPEVPAAASDALVQAYTLALKRSSNTSADLPEERADVLKDPAGVLKQIFPER
jgi:hypothetical protein